MRASIALAPIFACLVSLPAGADQSNKGLWTAQDRETAIEAATTTAAASSTLLLELADVLEQAGDASHARELALKAGSVLAPPSDLMNSHARERVVEKLVELGDIADAEALVSADAPPSVKASLLGKIGAARAQAGDLAGAQAQAAAVTALSASTGTSAPHLADASASAIREIGLALDAVGKPDEALQLAASLPNGLPKVWILGRSAQVFCRRANQAGERKRGREVAERAAQSARAALSAGAAAAQFGLVPIAAEALAVCDGPEAAITLVHELLSAEQVPVALTRMAEQFTKDGETGLAKFIAPPSTPPDPTDAEGLLDVAKRLAKQEDFDNARATARQASQTATKVARDPAQPAYRWFDHEALLGRIFRELVELNAYDDAIATVQPIEIEARGQYYVEVLAAEVRHNDAAAITRTLPGAIEVAKAPTFGNHSADILYRLTRTLALAGYLDAAREPYQNLQAMVDEALAKNGPTLEPFRFAELQAVMGDLPGALATADRAGPLTQKGSEAQMVVYLGLMTGGAPPTTGQWAQAKTLLNHDFAGPKASALSAIASALAAQGDVQGALQVKAGLNGGPGDALTGVRDSASAAIADAQMRAGDLRGAFSTIQSISQQTVRWKPLLKLVATPAHL